MTKDEIPWHTDQKNGIFSYMEILEEKNIIYEYFRIEKVYLCENVYGVMSSHINNRYGSTNITVFVTEKHNSHQGNAISSPRMITVW